MQKSHNAKISTAALNLAQGNATDYLTNKGVNPFTAMMSLENDQ